MTPSSACAAACIPVMGNAKVCPSSEVTRGVLQGEPCPTPDKVRPCDQSFGIDVYKTVRNLGLPCDVLQNKNGVQNRYGFVLLN